MSRATLTYWLTHLSENHVGVSQVRFLDSRPAAKRDLIAWETANHPYRLPDDYKAFLLTSNGLHLEWRAQVPHCGAPRAVGSSTTPFRPSQLLR